jgi:hypothetical protein
MFCIPRALCTKHFALEPVIYKNYLSFKNALIDMSSKIIMYHNLGLLCQGESTKTRF